MLKLSLNVSYYSTFFVHSKLVSRMFVIVFLGHQALQYALGHLVTLTLVFWTF